MKGVVDVSPFDGVFEPIESALDGLAGAQVQLERTHVRDLVRNHVEHTAAPQLREEAREVQGLPCAHETLLLEGAARGLRPRYFAT